MDIFKRKQTEVHMEQGPIGRTLLVFAAPILLSQILQQMYSIADCMIVLLLIFSWSFLPVSARSRRLPLAGFSIKN